MFSLLVFAAKIISSTSEKTGFMAYGQTNKQWQKQDQMNEFRLLSALSDCEEMDP